jgi:CBS domain.
MSNPPFQRQPPMSPLSTGVNINISPLTPGQAPGNSGLPSHQTLSHTGGQTPTGHNHHHLHHHSSRKPSIVELLSSPPPLPNNDHDEIHSFSLSRNASISSRASSHQPPSASGSMLGASHHHSSSISGLDWTEIPLSELTESNKLLSINSLYSVQQAFEALVSHNLTSIPVSLSQSDSHDLANCLTFDYSDLNTYLLLVMNKISINDLSTSEFKDPEYITKQIARAKRGEEVPVEFIIKLHPKNPFIKFAENDTLARPMETLGNGVHRIAITDPQSPNTITGILSQRRLIKYMWENARRFPALDFYLNSTLQDLKIGSTTPITIYEDQQLIEALHKMFHERVSSLAVIDRTRTLKGNISIVDVKNVSSSKNSHLLFKSVLNFIGYNLTQKGIEEGQDQFPIFHVNNQSSLGRVIAKLVATQSHRLWIVDSPTRSVSISQPATSQLASAPSTIEAALNVPPLPENNYGYSGTQGKLIGVVSLTDILGVFSLAKGKKTDPQFARNQRRRSSSSTTRSSIDSTSSSAAAAATMVNDASDDIFRKSYTLGKSDYVFNK